MGELVAFSAPASLRIRSTIFKPDERIGDLIPGGEDLENAALFADDEWDFTGHRTWKDKSGHALAIKFGGIAERWRDAAKEMAVFQMNPSLAPDRAPGIPMAQTWPYIQEPIAPISAQANIKMLGHALRIADAHNINAFDSDDWQRMRVLLLQPHDVKEKRSGATLSILTGRGRAQQLVALWQTSQIAGWDDLLGSELPFDGRETSELFSKPGKQNAVRPHEAVGDVLGLVAWFFDHIAEDIVNHIEWWAANTSDEPPLSSQEAFDSMLDLAAELAASNGGVLPGSLNRSGEVTIAASVLGRMIGIYDADDAYMAGRWAKSQLGDSVSYSLSATPCPLSIAQVPTSEGDLITWSDRLVPSNSSLDIWQRRLVYCAMYYLSATVMLRDSQLAELPFDSLTTEEITRPNGATYVKHTLAAFKTKNRRAGAATTVTVNGRIARIIELLHRVQIAMGYQPRISETTGVPVLFDQRLATPLGKKPRIDAREGLYLDQDFLKVIKQSATELYDRGVISRDLDHVALSMRQVRITCAQAYAVREHGQALAAAFGQWDTRAVANGYIGDVYRLITPIDTDHTQELAREDIGRRLTRLATDPGQVTGKGQPRLEAVLEPMNAGLSNQQPLTPARLKAIGKSNPNIEQGPLTLCVFQTEGALCGGKGRPDFRLCLPGQCRNSVMTLPDRARYELMRRQHLALKSDVLRRAAGKMDDANPDIAKEFGSTPDTELQKIIQDHVDDYIRAALEDRA